MKIYWRDTHPTYVLLVEPAAVMLKMELVSEKWSLTCLGCTKVLDLCDPLIAKKQAWYWLQDILLAILKSSPQENRHKANT